MKDKFIDIREQVSLLIAKCKKYVEKINDGSDAARERIVIIEKIITDLTKIALKIEKKAGETDFGINIEVDISSENPFVQIYAGLEKIITDCNIFAEDADDIEREILHETADEVFPLLLIAADHARDKTGAECGSGGCGDCSGC